MTKRLNKTPKRQKPAQTSDVPAGATGKAFRRPENSGGGPAGSGAGPRHAADDIGSDMETFIATDEGQSLANPLTPAEDVLEKGPPFAGRAGGAVGGSPAQVRSTESLPPVALGAFEDSEAAAYSPEPAPVSQAEPELGLIRLRGFEAIEYAEKQNLTLNKHPDTTTGPRRGLTVAEAEAVASDDADLIWLDVSKEEYYGGPPSSYEPDR